MSRFATSLGFNEDLSKLTDGNFWDVGRYRRVTKRIDDGAFLCDELARMYEERAIIEQKYSQMLESWAKRWEDRIDKGPEYKDGSMPRAWKGACQEARAVALVHCRVHDQIMESVVNMITVWKRAHYTRSFMKWKETKRIEEEFERAQRPWARLRVKLEKYRKRYFERSAKLDALQRKLQVLNEERSVPPVELSKLKVKLSTAQWRAERAESKYTATLEHLEGDRARYQSDMNSVFNHCQERELRRLQFFTAVFHEFGNAIHIDLGNKDVLLAEVFDAITNDSDLTKFARIHGNGMPLVLPQFIEWTPAASKQGLFSTSSTGSATMAATTQVQRYSHSGDFDMIATTDDDDDDDTDNDLLNIERDEATDCQMSDHEVPGSYIEDADHIEPTDSLLGSDVGGDDPLASQRSVDNASPTASNDAPSSKPESSTLGSVKLRSRTPSSSSVRHKKRFSLLLAKANETHLDDRAASEPDDVEFVSRETQALYDYTGLDDCELSFAAGDIIIQLSAEDERGWCQGSLSNGSIGAFPAVYVKFL